MIFLRDIVSLKPTIVLIGGHSLTSVKYHKIPRQYQNSAEKGKFRGSARNSTVRGKLWSLLTKDCITFTTLLVTVINAHNRDLILTML